MQAAETLVTTKFLAGTAITGAVGGVATASIWETIGIAPSVLFMALCGTALGLLFVPPGGSRGRLFALTVIYTVVSAALAVLLSELLDLADHRLDAALALLLAFFANTAIPALRESVNDRLKRTVGGNNDYGEPDTWRIDDGFGRREHDRDRANDHPNDFDGTFKGD